MKSDSSSPPLPSPSEASNQYLNRELDRIENERDALSRELHQIHQSYAWKLVDRYRRWLERHRNNALVRMYEKLAVWMLDRAVGIEEADPAKRYQLWIEAHRLSAEQIERAHAAAQTLPYHPLIEVELFLGDEASETLLASTIDSLRAQLYENWRVCVVSDSGLAATIEARLLSDSRIAAASRTSDGSNHGEFVTFLNQGDRLAPNAFYEVVRRLNRSPRDDLFYFDEDQIDSAGRRTLPFFKPDWSPELLLALNYFGKCFVIRKSLADEVGALAPGNSPYDLALRAVERTERIVHIPDVLYHRQADSASTSDDSEIRAVEDALGRRGERGRAIVVGPGLYAARYELRAQPLVSILIPTRDRVDLLRQCIESIEQGTEYKNYEVIVVDNDSAEPATLQYLRQLGAKAQVHRFPGRFNFSAINNFGASKAHGEFLLFLNNDTEVVEASWLRAMLEQAQRPDIGAVGAKLLFGDGRIQHAGIVLGLWGMVGHAFRFAPGDQRHHFGLADVIRNCSAVTAACMMMRRSVFEEVGGFDEDLAVEFNDVDLCLRLRQRGYRIVYTPFALLHHYESATRRHTHATADQEFFLARWESALKNGDPYYNRNLTLTREDWSIRL